MVHHKLFLEDLKKPEQNRILGLWVLTAAMIAISIVVLDIYVSRRFVSQEAVDLMTAVVARLGILGGGVIPGAIGTVKVILGQAMFGGLLFVFFCTLYFMVVLGVVYQKMGLMMGRTASFLHGFTAAVFLLFHVANAVLILTILSFLHLWIYGTWIWSILAALVGAIGLALAISSSVRALKEHFQLEAVQAFVMWLVGVIVVMVMFSVMVGAFLLQIAA
jgi:hypothetical protein